jgi:hypothetical protein
MFGPRTFVNRDSPILTLKCVWLCLLTSRFKYNNLFHSLLRCRNQNVQLLAGAWSHTRPSVIFTAATNGALYLWDILAQRITPTLCSQVVIEKMLWFKCWQLNLKCIINQGKRISAFKFEHPGTRKNNGSWQQRRTVVRHSNKRQFVDSNQKR